MVSGSILMLLLVTIASTTEPSPDLQSTDEVSDSVFKPTHNWQEIKKGQTVPAGLHYRINLQTGLKEAKLLDDTADIQHNNDKTDVQLSDTKSDFYGHSDRRGAINKSTKLFTRAELREMLKKIKDDSPEVVPLLTSTGPSQDFVSSTQKPSKPHTTLEELKEMLTFHAEIDIMLQRLQILVSPSVTPEQLVSALEELEYYVHQIDNARDFDILGGLSVVVRLLNHTDFRVQCAAALVLGAATQGNPVVQQLATSYDALPTLLSLLSTSESELLQRRVLYALGSLLRGQPTIVQSFLTLGGVERLSGVADIRTETVFVKIIVMLTDLLSVERNTGINISNLLTRLANSGWCEYTSQLLQSKNPVAIEKCVLLMEKLLPVCDYSDQYRLLHKISKQWNRNNEEKELMDVVRNMLRRIETSSKEEL